LGSDVARLFDAMAESYDELEPWYEHVYARLHTILRAELSPGARARPIGDVGAGCHGRARPAGSGRALDAGCGPGVQAAILKELGYETHGVDISGGLVAVAHKRLPASRFALADVEALPYRSESFDVITCCGSTLSFVDDPARALREIGRVLRPGGRLLLECEHKWSLDLGWALVSAFTRDSLGYGATVSALCRALARPLGESCVVDYPVLPPSGDVRVMRLRLFTMAELRVLLREAGLAPVRAWGIHALTNVIPSTVLHRERLSPILAGVYRALCAIDGALAASPPARWIANSLVVLAERQGG
jgi:MPBQ/MSBQ methyltransferase